MVSTIQATQAREGIETTEEHANQAYYVVKEAERVAFFDLAPFSGDGDAPDRRHEMFVSSLRSEAEKVRRDVARRDFGAIDGAPLAFKWVGLVAHIFRDAPGLEPAWGITRQGKATGEDLRWVRQWWEVDSSNWVPFAKGGDFCRFYSDVDLVLDWKPEHREELKSSGNGLPSEEHYFKPGLTWPRAASVFNVRILPEGCVFADKGPVVFPHKDADTWFMAGILNSDMALCFAKTLTSRENMGGRWEVGVVRRFPVPYPSTNGRDRIAQIARGIYESKANWDEGNEISTRFTKPWLLHEGIINVQSCIADRLHRLTEYYISEDTRMQHLYTELNEEVYFLYGIPDRTRRVIEETLGERPPELIWPQMEGKTPEQKRMEHVWRLLSYVVKEIVGADGDGIVPFLSIFDDESLLDRVHKELSALFPNQTVNQVEVEIVNELKRKVKGYKRVESIQNWLEDVCLDYHFSLYKNRPIFWHIASRQVPGRAAFSALVHYHKFDKDRMAKLRGTYLLEAISLFRREAGLAAQEGRSDDRLEWQAKVEEAEDLDRRLRSIQEGLHGPPAEVDCRILTPWKSEEERPRGWDPDIDDGVKVNIEPLQKARVLRIGKVV